MKNELTSIKYVSWMLLNNPENLLVSFDENLKLKFTNKVSDDLTKYPDNDFKFNEKEFEQLVKNKNRNLDNNEFLAWVLYMNPRVVFARYNSELNLELYTKVDPKTLILPMDWHYEIAIGFVSRIIGGVCSYRVRNYSEIRF